MTKMSVTLIYSICILSRHNILVPIGLDVTFNKFMVSALEVIEKQWTGTGAIKRQIPLLKPKREINQRTNGPVNAHLISWPSKAQNIQNLENIW